MSPFGCRPATVLAQPVIGTASRAAAVVHQYGHFRSSHNICSSTVTVRHHFRQPDSSKQLREKSCQTLWLFSKVWNFGKRSCIKWCNWKCMICEQSYVSAKNFFLVVNSWAPFSRSWGTEGGPTGPRPRARHNLQHDWPPSSGTWGALLFPSGWLAGAHKQSVSPSGEKILLALENSWAVPVKALCSHRSTTLRCVFLTARRRNSDNFNEKLPWKAPLWRRKMNCCSTAAVVAPYSYPPKLPRNTP
jgi:hypothetical protein